MKILRVNDFAPNDGFTVFSCPYAEINPKALNACKEYGAVYCTGQGNLILTLNGKTIKAYGIKPLE